MGSQDRSWTEPEVRALRSGKPALMNVRATTRGQAPRSPSLDRDECTSPGSRLRAHCGFVIATPF